MMNTDGCEVIIPRKYEQRYNDICKRWEDLTNLILEFEDYDKLIIWDVNNYIGIFKGYEIDKETADKMLDKEVKPLITTKESVEFVNDKPVKSVVYYHHPTKEKGRFEVDKPLHKNKSFRVKRLALYNYFVLGKPVDETLSNNRNIFDWCAGVRAKRGFKFLEYKVVNGVMDISELQKTVRYFVGGSSSKLIKLKLEDNSSSKVEAESSGECILINVDKSKSFDDYNINVNYYRKQIQKEISIMTPSTQISMF